MAGILALRKVHDVEAPGKVEGAPPAGAHSLDLSGVAPHIDIGAVHQLDLPHRERAAEIEGRLVSREQRHAAGLVAAVDALRDQCARLACT